MSKILVLGYYFHNNLGDDIFEYVFKNKILHNYNITIDKLENILHHNDVSYDAVIIGGGDLINDTYFNEDTLDFIQRNFNNIPVIFYGIGLSYPNLITKLDVGDHFFIRNKVDYLNIKDRYSLYNSFYTPDLAFHLYPDISFEENHISFEENQTTPNILENIGVCLPFTWLSENQDISFYEQIKCMITELSQDYIVHLIPFDTSQNKLNSDKILVDKLSQDICSCNIKVKSDGSIQDMISYFQKMDCIIGGRFHSIILSMITATPFISLYSTTKLHNLMLESPTFSRFFIKTDLITIDKQFIYDNLEYIKQNKSHIISQLKYYSLSKSNSISLNTTILHNIISNNVLRYSPPQYIGSNERTILLNKVITETLRNIDRLSSKNIRSVLNNYPISKLLTQRKIVFSDSLKRRITEEILWIITGDPYAPYYYGLMENVLDSGLVNRIDWLISDYYEKYKYKTTIPLYDNLTILNTNFQELHRSGWQFIVDNFVTKLTTSDYSINQTLIDMYVDKTFHWNKNFYKSKGLVPYTVDWIGFIHHTFSSYNNYYNCEMLFLDPDFLLSLDHCKCLIVMTKYLQRQILDSLQKVNKSVPVYVVYHPTEDTPIKFTWQNFIDNDNKYVVQIGNWLRNVHSIYQVELPVSSIIQSKAILKNKNSENYLPPPNFLENLFTLFNTKEPAILGVLDICKISFNNMHVKGLYEYIDKIEHSVIELDYLNNDLYDLLLSNNIVFIHLVDASAVNTLVECIIRNTPILINKIEPVVEVLGPNYPLYFSSNFEASSILNNPQLIHSAYTYLCNMNKTPFLISTFISNISMILDTVLLV